MVQKIGYRKIPAFYLGEPIAARMRALRKVLGTQFDTELLRAVIAAGVDALEKRHGLQKENPP